MKKLLYISFVLILVIAILPNASAQIVVEEDQPATVAAPKYDPWAGNIQLFTDPRLAVLLDAHKNLHYGGVRRMRGFRVQIYSGNDRTEAINRKVEFMRRYPRIKTYMIYAQPQYRVRVGNFATRADAAELYMEAIAIFGAAMIVPENVIVNTFDDYDD